MVLVGLKHIYMHNLLKMSVTEKPLTTSSFSLQAEKVILMFQTLTALKILCYK